MPDSPRSTMNRLASLSLQAHRAAHRRSGQSRTLAKL